MPIEKRKNGSKNIDDYIKGHEINKESKSGENMKIDDGKNGYKGKTLPEKSGNRRLILIIVIIGLSFVLFVIYTCFKFDSLDNGDDIQKLQKKVKDLEGNISDYKGKIKNLEGKIFTLENEGSWEVYTVVYGGGSDTSNNLSRIGEKSLGFPTYLKGKNCYVLGSKISGADGGTIRGYLGKNYNGNMFRFADNYEAEINNFEEKIEITKWNGSSNIMLTKSERDNLYFSLTLLCR